MCDELDELLAITRAIEVSPISQQMMEDDEDLDAVYVDYGDSTTPFDAKPLVTKITRKVTAAKRKPNDCSGNPTVIGKKNGPIFEDPGSNCINKIGKQKADNEAFIQDISEVDDAPISATNEALGMKLTLECIERGMGRDFMRMYKLESAGQCCPQQNGFRLGDVIHIGNNPALFVVKKADGQMVTAAKPTSNPNELITSNDGEWPTFTFRASEIQPMLNASINDVQNIIGFNDQAMPFDGSTIDESPMKVAQNDTKCNMVERIADNLDEILGMSYKDLCSGKDPSCNVISQPTEVVVINPDGSFGTTPRCGGYKIKMGD